SQEPGTPSHDMPGQVSQKVKEDRYHQLMSLQQEISLEVNESWIGRSLKVLVEAQQDGWLIGRSHRDAPDIDGFVFFKGEARPGDLVDVEVTEAEPYDLFGQQVGSSVKSRKKMEPLRMAPPKAPQ
ncbi:MAG: hypothetical protein CBB60_003990, partial [Armatimonadetes bacterium Cent15-Ar3]